MSGGAFVWVWALELSSGGAIYPHGDIALAAFVRAEHPGHLGVGDVHLAFGVQGGVESELGWGCTLHTWRSVCPRTGGDSVAVAVAVTLAFGLDLPTGRDGTCIDCCWFTFAEETEKAEHRGCIVLCCIVLYCSRAV